MMKKKNSGNVYSGDPEQYLQDEHTGEEYCRISGGIGWPSAAQPGALVIIGETREMDPILGRSHLHLLITYQTHNFEKLISKAGIFRRTYFIDRYFLDLSNEPMREAMYRAGPSFNSTQAPYGGEAGNLRFYIVLAQQLTSADGKILFFMEDQAVKNSLKELDETRIRSPAEDSPLLAAMGYVLAGMESFKHDPEEKHRMIQANKFLAIMNSDP